MKTEQIWILAATLRWKANGHQIWSNEQSVEDKWRYVLVCWMRSSYSFHRSIEVCRIVKALVLISVVVNKGVSVGVCVLVERLKTHQFVISCIHGRYRQTCKWLRVESWVDTWVVIHFWMSQESSRFSLFETALESRVESVLRLWVRLESTQTNVSQMRLGHSQGGTGATPLHLSKPI